MQGTNLHMIRRQVLEIEFNGSEEGGLLLQQQIGELAKHEMPELMEHVFDELQDESIYVSIDHLHVDLGELNLNRLQESWKERIVEKLKENVEHQIAAAIDRHHKSFTNKQSRNPAEDCASVILFFLGHGYLPWNVSLRSIQKLQDYAESNLFSHDMKGETWNHLIRQMFHPSHERRLNQHFSSTFLHRVLDQGMATRGIKNGKDFSIKQKLELLKSSMDAAHHPNVPAEKTLNTPALPLVTSGNKTLLPGEFIFIENAGLVLLHPFLTRLFEGLGLVKGQQLTDPEKVITVLHYINTGQTDPQEFELVLPKILCGIDISQDISIEISIQQGEQEEVDHMLRAVIQHWSALRDTSIDGLRQAFLMRPGKLAQKEDGNYLLEVETKSYDVLLDLMSWGFSRIQLPWMTSMLEVRWDFQQLI